MRNEIIWWLAGLVLSVLITLFVVALLLRGGHILPWQTVAAAAGLVVFLLAIVVITNWLERKG